MTNLEFNREPKNKAFDGRWLALQRSSSAAIARNDYDCASNNLTLAYFMTRNMSPQDPRVLLTWELIAELREIQHDFECALFWRQKLVNQKHRMFGPSAFLLYEMRQLARLYSLNGNWQKAMQIAEWASSLAAVAPRVQISERVRRSSLDSSAIHLINLVRGTDRRPPTLTQVS